MEPFECYICGKGGEICLDQYLELWMCQEHYIRKYAREESWYFSHPYASISDAGSEFMPFKDIKENNIRKCTSRSNKLIDLGLNVHPVILELHQLNEDKPRDWDYWMGYCLDRMKEFDGIILAPEWDISKGCRIEREEAIKEGMVVLDYDKILEVLE